MAREDSFDIFGADPFGRDIIYGLSTGRDRLGLAPARYLEQGQDISQGTVKRKGYFGEIPTNDDSMMTEFSSAFEVGGKTVQYPLIVPTLTVDELRSVRDQNITPEINQKAQQFALDRLSRGLDPFATTQELRYPQPQGLNPAPSTDRMQESPRSLISGLFSDVLGGTLNMPSMPRTGVPSLDLLYANRNPLFNLMGVGDVQKTAERISYGEPLTTGSGMTTKPREETIFAGMAVAPFAPIAGRVAGRTGRAVGRMAGEEINAAMTGQPTRSVLGQMTPKPMGIVPPSVVRQIDMPVNLPTSQEFLNAVIQEPSAAITPQGLLLNVKRQQVPQQSGMESVRTGVFYLPESQSASVYKGKQGYGGSEPIQGSTLYKNPLFVKGATGGKAPESAYDQLLGKGSYQTMRNEALDVASGYRTPDFQRVEKTRAFLEKYGGDPDLADYIVENSKYGNQLTYALQENIVANAVRNAGHDAVLGYSKGRGGKGEFFSEIFDVREQSYPTPQGDYQLMPQFENLLKKEPDPFRNTIGSSIR